MYFWLADDPETAYYLSEEERHLMLVRKQRQIGYSTSGDQLHKEDVYKALKDWKVWVFAVGQFGVDTMLYGYSTFLPTIIKGLGTWSTAEVQALTVPCYALGAITYLVVAHFSDKLQQRGLAIMPFAAVSFSVDLNWIRHDALTWVQLASVSGHTSWIPQEPPLSIYCCSDSNLLTASTDQHHWLWDPPIER